MKLAPFQQYLHEKKIPLAILTHPDVNITYFTQIKPSYAFLLITPKQATLYLTALDKKPTIPLIKFKVLTKHWSENIKSIKKIGINKSFLTVASSERIKKLFPKAKFIDISAKLEELREEKTPEEVQKITKACILTSDAFAALLQEFPKRLCILNKISLYS